MTDPLDDLAHDHADLNRRVLALGSELRALQRAGTGPAALEASITELREQLFYHFAREEEGLFPFVADAIPELGDEVNAMSIAHDTICGALARMVHLAATNAALSAMLAMYDRFTSAYSEHARAEATLFATLEGRLDPMQRTQLAALVDGL